MTAVEGRFVDGLVALVRPVAVEVSGGGQAGALTIRDTQTGHRICEWPRAGLMAVPSDRNSLRIGSEQADPAARLIVEGPDDVERLRAALPGLQSAHRQNRARQFRFIGAATGALAVAIVAFVFGVPLIANQVVALIPPQWESDLGDRVRPRIEEIFAGGGVLRRCDADREAAGNRIIAAFVGRVLEGTGTPFEVRVDVVRSDIPNAFALPGGQIYYFSSLLEATDDPDAFAGVLAHEIGHVVGRHGMQNVVSSAGTGVLIGLLLGDVTGLSVGAMVGQQVVNSRFSREAERAADQFAIAAAERLGFDIGALGRALQHIAADSAYDRSMSLISSHPLTDARAELLQSPAGETAGAFTAKEWRAIQLLCETD